MNYIGLIIGIASFFCIGLFHPIVIQVEFHLGKRVWWAFALIGLVAAAASLCMENYLLSTVLGVFAFSCFWSVLELFQQEERVRKGWFPRNPRRKYPFDEK